MRTMRPYFDTSGFEGCFDDHPTTYTNLHTDFPLPQ